MNYQFPSPEDCYSRTDLEAYSTIVLDQCRSIVAGGDDEATAYALAWYREHRTFLNYNVASDKERDRLVKEKAEVALKGAKAALAFGGMKTVTNDYGHRLVCIPSMEADMGRYLGYIPWVEEKRLPNA